MGKEELKASLDYILNAASDEEFEVIVKAVQRRQKDRHLYSKMGGMNPERAAKTMSADIQKRFGTSMESIRGTVNGFVADIIRREAPEIPEEDLRSLLDMYAKQGTQEAGAGRGGRGDLPPEAALSMVKRFMAFSTGEMSASEQQYLWESMPRWQDEYWKSFSPEIKALIDGSLKGKIDADTFWNAVYSILGL
jgi:hypothetical protein